MEQPSIENFNGPNKELLTEFEEKLDQLSNEMIDEFEKSPNELWPPKGQELINFKESLTKLLSISLRDSHGLEDRIEWELENIENVVGVLYRNLNGDSGFKNGNNADFDLYQTFERKLFENAGILVVGPQNSIGQKINSKIHLLAPWIDKINPNEVIVHVGNIGFSLPSLPDSDAVKKAVVTTGTPDEAKKNLEQWNISVEQCKKYKTELLAKKEASRDREKPLESLEEAPEMLKDVSEPIVAQTKHLIEKKKYAEAIEGFRMLFLEKSYLLEGQKRAVAASEAGKSGASSLKEIEKTRISPEISLPDVAKLLIAEFLPGAWTKTLNPHYLPPFKNIYDKFRASGLEPGQEKTATPEAPPTIEKLLEQIDGLVKEKELEKAQKLVDVAIEQLRALLETKEFGKIKELGPRIKEAKKAIIEALAEQKNEKTPLLSFISDLQTAIKKSAYQDREDDIGHLDEIAKLQCLRRQPMKE